MMLLDSNVLIWWITGDKRLGPKAKDFLASDTQQLIVSLITLFEIELKKKTGKLYLPGPTMEFADKFHIQIYSPSANELPALLEPTFSHRDPFDHAVVGLGALKNWSVMTSDQILIDEGIRYTEVMDART